MLNNIVVVEEFHVNIISEARLFESGVWYSRYNYILRYGKEDKYIVLKWFK
jgi:hypothetical protein